MKKGSDPFWRNWGLTPLLLLMVAPAAAAPQLVGWIEPVSIAGGQIVLEGKLDTGADVSSLDARDMRTFTRDGRAWVSFAIPDRRGKRVRFERPVERQMEIKKASSGTQYRPVIEIDICLAGVRRTTLVNLVDRAHLSTPALIGRSFLEGHFAVDSGAKNTTTPDCPPEKAGRRG